MTSSCRPTQPVPVSSRSPSIAFCSVVSRACTSEPPAAPPAPGSPRWSLTQVSETINVTGASPLIETTASSVGQVVDVKRIESLPLNGRQFANLAATVPGVGLSFHSDPTKSTQYAPLVNGGAGRNINYQIDGGDNNDDTVGGLLQQFPLEAVEQFNFQTQRFKAAVSQRDIADWYGFWFTADFTLFQPTWFRKAPWEDPQDFAARSPITHIAKVTTPLMLVNGDADYRTPPSDGGEMMFRALKYRKIPTVMVRFPRETHELSRSGEPWHRVERLQHIVGWMDQWLMGKKNVAYATQ